MNYNRIGQFTALLTALLTAITFVIAIFTPPYSGPFCVANCVEYPYTDTLSRFPRDFYWIYAAMFQLLVYLFLVLCIHESTPDNKKLLSRTALVLTIMSVTILLTDYFTQITIVPPSLLEGEDEGIALLSQYNPHGLFIAMEELGYLLMAISFVFIGLSLSHPNALSHTIRWLFLSGFILVAVAFVVITFLYGLMKEYRFEVAVITINWLVLIINGILLIPYFKRNTI